MGMTVFNKKDKNVSSMRYNLKNGKNKINFSRYTDPSKGGMTFKSGNITTRFNNKGQSIGMGIKTGNHTTYFGKNGNVVSNLTGF